MLRSTDTLLDMISTPGLLGWLYWLALVSTGIGETLSAARYTELREVGDSPWYIVSAGPVATAIYLLGSTRNQSAEQQIDFLGVELDHTTRRTLSVVLCLYLIRFQFNTGRKWMDRAYDPKRRHPRYHSPAAKCFFIWLFHDAAGLLTALWLANEV